MTLSTIQTAGAEAMPANLVAEARRLVPLIRSEAPAIEQGRRLTPAVHEAYVRAGFYRMTMPEDPRPLPEIMRVLETLATGDLSAAWSTWTPLGVPHMSGFIDEAGVQEMFAPREACLVNSSVPAGKAVPVEGGYRVSGRWPFMSGIRQATYASGFCLVYDGDAPRVGPDGSPALLVPVWPAEDCTVIDNWDTTGLRGTGSHDVEVQDLFVPSHRVADFSRPPRPQDGPMSRLHVENAANVTCAAMAVGGAQHALEAFRELAPNKKLRDGTTLAESPQAQVAVATAATRLAQARGHLYETAETMWDAILDGTYEDEAWFPRTALASTTAVDTSIQVTLTLYRAAATTAIRTGALDRILRDLLTLGAHQTVQRSNILKHAPHFLDAAG